MEDIPSFNMTNNNNNQNEITPQCSSNVFQFKGELISINDDVLNLVLSEINQRFILEDFSQYKTEKQVFDYFYNKEKSSLGSIDLNFKDNEIQRQFLKSFVSELIEEKYQYNKSLTDIRNKIDKKMNEIIEDIKNCNNIDSFNLSKKYIIKFETDKIPQFLEKNIFDAIEVIRLIKDLNLKSEKNKSFNKKDYFDANKKCDSIMNYYSLFLEKKSIPFDGGNKEILFDILLYSNLKDIYKNPKIKELFINNFTEISDCFKYYEGISIFESEINKRKESRYIDEKLKNIFKKYEKNDYHPYAIASFFFLVLNKMRDINIKENKKPKSNNKKNNFNNPLILRVLKNILNSYAKYCSSNTYNLKTYMYLFN